MVWLVLAALTLLFLAIEHHLGLHEGNRAVRYFSLIPMLAGAALLRPVQLLPLGLFILSAQQIEGLQHPNLDNPEAVLRLTGRILILVTCLWISRLRVALQRRNLEMKVQLVNSLRASTLAHEIRQPLSVILLSSRELLRIQEAQQSSDPAGAATLGRLHQAAEQLDNTTRAMATLLRSVKTERGGRVDLAAVVRTTLSVLEPQLITGGIRLQRQGLEQPLPLRGDGEQLRIACSNLIRNALDAVQSADPARRQLCVSLEQQADRACLCVSDTGPGLPCGLDELLDRASSKPNGMGLGLWIVHTIAQHHGGVLEAGRSRKLGGAELRLSLPLRP